MPDTPPAIVAEVDREVARALQADCALAPDARLVVGLSGGADSTALLLALLAQGLGPRLRAVHLHHGLRAAADADLAWCAAFCAARGVACVTDHLSPPAPDDPRGPEAAMREARLAWWHAHLAADEVLALGHHADDAVETLLLRLLRGANASGLTGLRAHRTLGGLRVLRPLLHLRHADLEAYLLARGVADWRRDASNTDPRFLRNRIRHELLPLLRELGDGDAGLLASYDHLCADAAALEAQVPMLPLTPTEAPTVPVAALQGLPPALLVRALRQLAPADTHWVPRRHAVERLRELLAREPLPVHAQLDLEGDWVLLLHQGGLTLCSRRALAAAADALPAAPMCWDWRRHPTLQVDAHTTLRARAGQPQDLALARRGDAPDATGACLSLWPATALPCPLLLRPRQPGDRMQPFGAASPTRLKKLIANAHAGGVTRWVLCDEAGEILWVPGVRRASAYPIEGESDATVTLLFESNGLS